MSFLGPCNSSRFYIKVPFTFKKVVLPMTLKPVLVLVFFVVVGPVGVTCLSVDKSNGSKGHVLKMYSHDSNILIDIKKILQCDLKP